MNEVEELQNAIKARLAELGLSQADLAEKIYVEEHDDDDEQELAKFTAALKKQLSRPSTPAAKLRRYLEILRAGKHGLEGHYPAIASDLLPKVVLAQMHMLSDKIENMLQEKERKT